MNEEKFCYVATGPCGCRLAVTVDDSGIVPPKETAKVVADYIKRGSTVSRETVGEFREKPFGHQPGCEHYREPARQESIKFA